MPRSRTLVLLSMTSVFILLFGLMGWCGGPVAQRPGTDAQARGGQPGSPGAQAGNQGGLSVAGSGGSGYANGSNGVSPWVNFSSVGLKNTFAWNARARYDMNVYNVGASVIADFTQARFKGSDNSWQGYAGHPVLTVGLPVDSKLDLDLFRVSVEAGLINTSIEIHPKLEWLEYIDRFQLTNSFTGSVLKKSRTYANWGVGLCGTIDIGRWMGYGYYTGMFPVIKLAASLGQGSNMRYYSWEAWAKVFSTPGWQVFGYSWMPAPQVAAEVGWIHYSFDQTREQDSPLPPAIAFGPAGARDNAAQYRLDIPMGRAVVSF